MKKRQKPIEPLREEEVAELLQAASRKAPTGIRNRALMSLLYYSGLRVGEALALELRDLDPEAGTINVRRGKGSRQRTVALHPAALAYLERWLDRRRDLGANGRQPIFCTLQGGPLSARYVRQALNRYAERAGIEKRVHPHGLRHSHAAHLAMAGVPVHVIQRQLGHSSLATTSTYVDAIGPAEVVEAVRGAWA